MRDATLLSERIVAQKTSYLEWDTQPSLFKRYPDFCYRIPIDEHPSLAWIGYVRSVSDERSVGGRPYRRFNVPSAGNLHPIEMYVQIRNVKGVLSGIYHVDPLNRQLVLIAEIGRDGIEPLVCLSQRMEGVIVMFSLVPFRSYWKYGLRSWRYLHLDLGHQIGAFEAVCDHFGHTATKLSIPDPSSLNEAMGMGDSERIVACYGIGIPSLKEAMALKAPAMRVCPCDYTLPHPQLDLALDHDAKTIVPKPAIWPSSWRWDETIHASRRSAREFDPDVCSEESLRRLIDALGTIADLEIRCVLLQAQTMHHGWYHNGSLTQEGEYRDRIVHLLLGQRFIAQASMVVLIFSPTFDAHAHVEAGRLGQWIALWCEAEGVACSGIGAFYDDEAKLWTPSALIYAVAVGGKR